MTIVPPAPDEPRRPDGPRDPGDAWVVADDGTRYWGRFGAAGLLALDAQRGILLQHRVSWSHFGGTWGLPGGARHEGESAADAALREAAEEAGVPADAVRPRLLSMLDVGIWSYGTVLADVVTPFEPVISDAESRELSWVPVADVDDYPLHPGLATAWPQLRTLLDVRPAVVVDAANVVGSVPDGWWRDRPGAASRLLERLAAWARQGVDAAAIDLPAGQWFPEVSVVLEGAARTADDVTGVHVVRAPAAGDDAIVDEASRLVSEGRRVIVVTADRELSRRAAEAGGAVRSAGWLLGLLSERA
ncbi:NUDIX domain-containing protein [Microbacterium sp. zg.Y625]|uniref:NUDIX domain-containing protein n=1 Tax=Microbacterium jiangjiandongii TaxID=3049071 RepID=UPI00214ADCD9|nr:MULTISPECIES: NUDIX domain-containing protein [unclassified Microbacterium]MCR2792365.1 NUDIX domain-containing protein [Microbacterium sp. zg.Y625]WIM26364.1 NUDIX domain-containing protein [Microbacterium sp. zg-Y625]